MYVRQWYVLHFEFPLAGTMGASPRLESPPINVEGSSGSKYLFVSWATVDIAETFLVYAKKTCFEDDFGVCVLHFLTAISPPLGSYSIFCWLQ